MIKIFSKIYEKETLLEYAVKEHEYDGFPTEFIQVWENLLSLSLLSTEEIDQFLERDLNNVDIEKIKEYL